MNDKLEALMLLTFVGVSAYCMYSCIKLLLILQWMALCNLPM